MRLLSRSLILTASLLFMPLVAATSADARPCLTKSQAVATARGETIHYRSVHNTQCWYVGEGADKSEFAPPIGRAGSEGGLRPSPSRRAQPADDIDILVRRLCGDFCPTEFNGRWPR